MLTVDISPTSWISLFTATLVSVVPIFYLRFKLNGLSMDGEEARLLGLTQGRLRIIALICGAIMILAAQVHIGAVAIMSLIVPFMARVWFGCEFSKQFVGVMCISPVLLLICRDIADLIPFVADGLAIGSVVSVVALPLLVIVISKQFRGWE
jgi:iron complex transport system permease protein